MERGSTSRHAEIPACGATSEGVPSLLPSRRRVLVGALAGAAALLAGLGGAPAPAGSGPTSAVRPTVAGSPTQGARLVASPGSWTGSGTIAYAFQWYRCDTMGARCVALRGVTERIRRIGPTDVGHTLSLEVRATDAKGTTAAYASLVGPDRGQAGRARREEAAVRVRRLGARRDGARRPRPLVAAADGVQHPVGALQRPRSRVRAHRRRHGRDARGGRRRSRPSAGGDRAGAVARGDACRVQRRRRRPPSRSRAARPDPRARACRWSATVVQQGQKLNGAAGSWTGSGALRYAYQWYRCDASGAHCKAIRGATAPTYTPVAKDVGQTLGFAVRAHDAVGASTAFASLVGPVAARRRGARLGGPADDHGLATQGQTLQVSTGGWTQTPSAFGYQWQRCNANGRRVHADRERDGGVVH